MLGGGLYLVAICLSLGLVSAKHKQNTNSLSPGCGECEPSKCKAPTHCVAGLVKDGCDCCDVCGKTEFELCQHTETGDDEVFLGRCGDNMECVMREDLEEGDAPEAVCICKIKGDLCGSDGISYENLCQLQTASISTNEPISVKNKGPCRTAPALVTKPKHIKDKLGNNIGLLCEATGFPIPGIEWTWTRVDGKTEYLPSDDMRISANMRGGPEKMQITGWLQIQELQKHHEGDYTCIAQNELGMAKATARVNVLDHED